ncbi:MAG: hypothetical protein MI861_11650, partial [Pirellulales bacterium]|nr:hypothetical protein [Pirellulales bacterium]
AQTIAREDDSAPMLAATAELGVIRLTGGSPQSGVRLLKRALEDHTDVQWPGRAGVEADYALGLLMVGDKAGGISRLAQAQKQFEAEGEIELLAKSLWNQLQYLEHTESDKDSITAVKTRLEAMQI